MTMVGRVELVHSLPGRTRFRCSRLRGKRERATLVADSLSGLDGMVEVKVRPSTGGVLCLYDPKRLSVETLEASIRDLASIELPREETRTAAKTPKRSSLARAVVRAAQEINADLLESTDGKIDLGTLSALSFFAVGALEIVASRRLPAPPWFNLAWWAVQTFTEYEREE